MQGDRFQSMWFLDCSPFPLSMVRKDHVFQLHGQLLGKVEEHNLVTDIIASQDNMPTQQPACISGPKSKSSLIILL